jgi:DNA transposition AAA+ family ATPase
MHTSSHPEYKELEGASRADTTEALEAVEREVAPNLRASWNISLDTVRQNTAHYKPEEQETLIALMRWCIDPRHPMSREDAARRLGCSGNLIYQLLAGVYRNPDKSPRGPSAELLSSIREFLAVQARRYALGDTDFVLTPTAKKIVTAFDLARESQSIVFVYGPSHVGKTWTAERYYLPNNNHGKTIYVRMKAASGLGGMVRAMAAAAGISDKSNTADLIQRIKNASSPNTLWILDEVHLLANTYRKGSFFACMEVIREIHDETQCGMALIFTILDDVKAAKQKELQQLWRRGVHKVPLPLMPTRGDLEAILKHNGLGFPDKGWRVTVRKAQDEPYEILRQLAREEGLKSITERLRYARRLGGRSGSKTISWEHFVEAHLTIQKQAVQEGEWA